MTGHEGLAVVVTGAGSGIGYATARAFCDLGARPLLVGRDRERLRDAAGRLPNAVAVVADVTDPAAVERIVATAESALGGIDVVVNNAGLFSAADLRDIDATDPVTVFGTNVVAPIALVQASLAHLEERQGAVINVTSTYGHRAAPGASVYAASKAALESLTRSWAVELAPHGVRVNAVAPGPTDMPILRRAGFDADQAADHERAIVDQVPLHRVAQADEVASTVVHIATHRYITGQVVSVDGGLSVA